MANPITDDIPPMLKKFDNVMSLIRGEIFRALVALERNRNDEAKRILEEIEKALR